MLVKVARLWTISAFRLKDFPFLLLPPCLQCASQSNALPDKTTAVNFLFVSLSFSH